LDSRKTAVRESNFPLALLYKLPREVSDHNPIILSTLVKPPMKNLNFRFELAWLKHLYFLPKVQEIWESPCLSKTTFDKIQIKLNKFKKYFKGWVLIFKVLERSCASNYEKGC
jgi:hypothetical protein